MVERKREMKKKSVIECIIFFSIAFGINFLTGIMICIDHTVDANLFASFIMLLPANGAFLARYYRDKRQITEKVIDMILLACSVLNFGCICLVFLKVLDCKMAITIIEGESYLVGIGILVYLFLRNREISFLQNANRVQKDILFLLVILFVRNSIRSVPLMINGDGEILMRILLVPLPIIGIFFTIGIFYGEESGWRGYLQEKLQRHFGKIGGVLLLGMLWWVWHLPLWMIQGNEWSDLLCGIPTIIGICTFFGYLYMKTGNVWLCAIIHGVYNSMGVVMISGDGWLDYLALWISGIILFIYCIRKPEYQGKPDKG